MSVDNYGNHPNLEEERRKKAESFRLNIPDRDNYDDYNYMDDYDDETSELNSYSGEDVREQIERQSRHALKKQKRAEKKEQRAKTSITEDFSPCVVFFGYYHRRNDCGVYNHRCE